MLEVVPTRRGVASVTSTTSTRPIPDYSPPRPSFDEPEWWLYAPTSPERRDKVRDSVMLFQLSAYQNIVTPFGDIKYRSSNYNALYGVRSWNPIHGSDTNVPAGISDIADTNMLCMSRGIFMPLRSMLYYTEVSPDIINKRIGESCATFGGTRLDLNVFAGSNGHARISGPIQLYCPSKGFSASTTYGHLIELPRVIDETWIRMPVSDLALVLSESGSSGECCEQYGIMERVREKIGGEPNQVVLAFLSEFKRVRPNAPILGILDGDGGGFQIASRLDAFDIDFIWFYPKELKELGCRLKRVEKKSEITRIESVVGGGCPSHTKSVAKDIITDGWGYSFCSLAWVPASMDMLVDTLADTLHGKLANAALPKAKSERDNLKASNRRGTRDSKEEIPISGWIDRPLVTLKDVILGQLPEGYAHTKSSKIVIRPGKGFILLQNPDRPEEDLTFERLSKMIRDNYKNRPGALQNLQRMLTNGSKLATYYPDTPIGQEAASLNEWVVQLVSAMKMCRVQLPDEDQCQEAQSVILMRIIVQLMHLDRQKPIKRKRESLESGSEEALVTKKARHASSDQPPANQPPADQTAADQTAADQPPADQTPDPALLGPISTNGDDIPAVTTTTNHATDNTSTSANPEDKATKAPAKRKKKSPKSAQVASTDNPTASNGVINVSSDSEPEKKQKARPKKRSKKKSPEPQVASTSTSNRPADNIASTTSDGIIDLCSDSELEHAPEEKQAPTRKKKESPSPDNSTIDDTTPDHASNDSEDNAPKKKGKGRAVAKSFHCSACDKTKTGQSHPRTDSSRICHACYEKARRDKKKAEPKVEGKRCATCPNTKTSGWHPMPGGGDICEACYCKLSRQRRKAKSAEEGGKCIECGTETTSLWHPRPNNTKICHSCDRKTRIIQSNAKAAENGDQCYECGATETSEWRPGPLENTRLCNSCRKKAGREVAYDKGIDNNYRCDKCTRDDSPRWLSGPDDTRLCYACYSRDYNAEKNAEAAERGAQCSVCDTVDSTQWHLGPDGEDICRPCNHLMRVARKAQEGAEDGPCQRCNKIISALWHLGGPNETICHTCWVNDRKISRQGR